MSKNRKPSQFWDVEAADMGDLLSQRGHSNLGPVEESLGTTRNFSFPVPPVHSSKKPVFRWHNC